MERRWNVAYVQCGKVHNKAANLVPLCSIGFPALIPRTAHK